jgi:hypothetical protein
MDNIPSSFGTVNSMLNQFLDIVNAFSPFERQYFLPGTASSSGYTDDDISIILVKRR